MPLYLVNHNGQKRLINAATPASAKNYVLSEMKAGISVSTPSALDVATLVSDHGLRVEDATKIESDGHSGASNADPMTQPPTEEVQSWETQSQTPSIFNEEPDGGPDPMGSAPWEDDATEEQEALRV